MDETVKYLWKLYKEQKIQLLPQRINKTHVVFGILYLPHGFFKYDRSLQLDILIAGAVFHKKKMDI